MKKSARAGAPLKIISSGGRRYRSVGASFFQFSQIRIYGIGQSTRGRGRSERFERRTRRSYVVPGLQREISLRRCPLSYRVSTARRNFCPTGHVQPRNRYAEEKISMIIADADGRRRCPDANLISTTRRPARRNGAHAVMCFGFLTFFRHPVCSHNAATRT